MALSYAEGEAVQPIPTRERAVQDLAFLAEHARVRNVTYDAATPRPKRSPRTGPALREVWMLEMHGGEAQPWATEQAARHHAVTEGQWDPGSVLTWRPHIYEDNGVQNVGATLYANGDRTLTTYWAAKVCDSTLGPDSPDAPDMAACRVCGCTETEPCDGGCAWVTGDDNTLAIDLCTACAWTIARDAFKAGLFAPADLTDTELAAIESNDDDAPTCRECATWPCPRHATAEDRAEQAAAELAEMKANYLRACKTITDMHAAALGEVCEPIRGVVEDVADVRTKMLAALGALADPASTDETC